MQKAWSDTRSLSHELTLPQGLMARFRPVLRPNPTFRRDRDVSQFDPTRSRIVRPLQCSNGLTDMCEN
jgi:hypothetical protein